MNQHRTPWFEDARFGMFIPRLRITCLPQTSPGPVISVFAIDLDGPPDLELSRRLNKADIFPILPDRPPRHPAAAPAD